MKHLYTLILFAAFSLASFSTFAQQQTDGFWGVPFYSTRAEALKLVSTKKLKPFKTTPQGIACQNVVFGGDTCNVLVMEFYRDKFVYGVVIFLFDTYKSTIDNYFKWKKKLIEKYGEMALVQEKVPDYINDLNSESRLRTGIEAEELKLESMWITTDEKTNGKVSIILNMSPDKTITLSYADEKLGLNGLMKHAQKVQTDY